MPLKNNRTDPPGIWGVWSQHWPRVHAVSDAEADQLYGWCVDHLTYGCYVRHKREIRVETIPQLGRVADALAVLRDAAGDVTPIVFTWRRCLESARGGSRSSNGPAPADQLEAMTDQLETITADVGRRLRGMTKRQLARRQAKAILLEEARRRRLPGAIDKETWAMNAAADIVGRLPD